MGPGWLAPEPSLWKGMLGRPVLLLYKLCGAVGSKESSPPARGRGYQQISRRHGGGGHGRGDSSPVGCQGPIRGRPFPRPWGAQMTSGALMSQAAGACRGSVGAHGRWAGPPLPPPPPPPPPPCRLWLCDPRPRPRGLVQSGLQSEVAGPVQAATPLGGEGRSNSLLVLHRALRVTRHDLNLNTKNSKREMKSECLVYQVHACEGDRTSDSWTHVFKQAICTLKHKCY